MDDAKWNKLWQVVGRIQGSFPDGMVFIGGIAVYAHMRDSPTLANMSAYSHDADFMISLDEYGHLHSLATLNPNRRLAKVEFEKDGFSFDVYVDRQHNLRIPFDAIIEEAQIKSGLRVASLEHLLCLKIAAYIDRKSSDKGQKDEDDIARLLMLLSERGIPDDCDPFVTEEDFGILDDVLKSQAFLRLACGNRHMEKKLRQSAKSALEEYRDRFRAQYSHKP